MTAQAQHEPYITPQEYLVIERAAEYKSEYFDGEMFAMAGASRQHNLIITNIVGEFHQQLKGRQCNVYANDLRVKNNPTGLYTYPDIIVGCGDEQFEDEELDTLLNPTLIIEVLSKSTKGYDKGMKFTHYRQIESLREYLLVAQKTYHIEHYMRQPDNRWLLEETRNLQDTLSLPSISCHLALAEVYDKVELKTT